jgi:hypothetical protein
LENNAPGELDLSFSQLFANDNLFFLLSNIAIAQAIKTTRMLDANRSIGGWGTGLKD